MGREGGDFVSIVINVISNRSSWIASDGLQRDTATGRVVNTDLQKFEVLNTHLCIGYTGCYEHARKVVDYLKLECPNIEIATSDLAARYTKALVDEAVRQFSGFNAQFVVTGTLSNHQIASFAIKRERAIESFSCAPGKYKFIILNNLCLGNLEKMILRRSHGGNITESSILAGMRDLIRDTARYDNSVNTHMAFHRVDAL